MNADKKPFFRTFPGLAAGSFSLVAAIYFALSPRLAPGLYARQLFRPERYPEGDWDVAQVAGCTRQECYFRAVDGAQLHGWLFENPSASHIILFSHGNRGNLTGRMTLVEMMLQAGASVFIYDYRGYGRSEGTPTIHGICEDGLMAFDYLVRGRGFRPGEIVVYGESLGTAVTSEVAADRPCAGVVLQSGFSSLRRIGCEMVPITRIYPESLYPQPLLDSGRRMSKERKPLLVIHGRNDETVPFSHGEDIFARAAEPKSFLVLDKAGHTDLAVSAPAEYVAGLRRFLQSLPVDVDCR